jgi:hypothetical protein
VSVRVSEIMREMVRGKRANSDANTGRWQRLVVRSLHYFVS